MTEASVIRRLKAHRVLTLAMIHLALFGWGAFAYSSHSAAVAWQGLRETVTRSETDRAELLAHHSSALTAAVAEVSTLQRQLLAAKTALEERQDDVSETGSIKPREAFSSTQQKPPRKLRR